MSASQLIKCGSAQIYETSATRHDKSQRRTLRSVLPRPRPSRSLKYFLAIIILYSIVLGKKSSPTCASASSTLRERHAGHALSGAWAFRELDLGVLDPSIEIVGA